MILVCRQQVSLSTWITDAFRYRNVAGIRCSEIPPLVWLQHGGRRSSAMAVAVVIRVVLILFNTTSPCFDRIPPGGKFFRNSCSVASSTGTILSEALSYRCC